MAAAREATEGGGSPGGEADGRAGTLDDFRFGAIAVWGGLVTREAVDEALAEQSAARSSGEAAPPVPNRLGELLVAHGRLTDGQVRRVLRVQLQRLPAEGHLIFGRIAEAHRFVSPEENRRALDIQSREILAGGRARTIGEILQEMGAIDREAADAIASYQAKGDSTRMARAGKARVEKATEAGSSARAGPEAGGTTVAERRGPEAGARPAFLPRGRVAFLADHSTWLVVAAAVIFAVVIVVFKERIFGVAGESHPRPAAEPDSPIRQP